MNAKNTRTLAWIALLLTALIVSACGTGAATQENIFGGELEATEAPQIGAGADDSRTENTAPAISATPAAGYAAPAEESGERGGGPASDSAADPGYAGAGGGETGSVGGAPPAVVPTAMPFPTMAPPILPPDQQFDPNTTAGEIDDNEDFSAYLQYRVDYMNFLGYPVYDLDVTERHIIEVRTSNGLPVLGAEVTVYAGQTVVATLRTAGTGRAYFFPRAYTTYPFASPTDQTQSLTVTVRKGTASQTFTLSRQQTDVLWPVTLNTASAQAPVQLDVLFLIDSTGSMGDEIEELRANLLSISAQIAALPGRPDVRFGMVTYRDRGDEYVTRLAPFTGDVQSFQTTLNQLVAAGGGDYPESLNEGLHRAVWDMDWRGGDTVSLIILVADAPPQMYYSQDYNYAVEMQAAAERGIKIHPIAASGTDDQAEYVFRQLAQYTGGHFIFLTYAETPQSSGEPGTDHSVPEGSYTVEDLDALVVRLISEELAALLGQQQ